MDYTTKIAIIDGKEVEIKVYPMHVKTKRSKRLIADIDYDALPASIQHLVGPPAQSQEG